MATTNTTMEVLMAKVTAAKAEVQAETMAKLADNKVFIQTLAQQELKAEGIATLRQLVDQVSAITDNRSRLFGYGEGTDLVVQLASSWLYAKTDVKPLVEAIVPALPKYAEDLVGSMGKLPYFSTNLGTIVPGEQMNTERFKALIEALAVELGVYIDTSQITEQRAEALYRKAQLRAELASKEADNTNKLRQNKLEL